MKGGDGGGGDGVGPPPPLDWKFSQVFGERSAGEEVQEVDIISAIEFDKSGDHLATGDRGGRVVLFERTDTKDNGVSRKDLEKTDYSISRHPEFRYKTEFQSHEPEFDYLKSLEIEEKINKIRWCQTANSALFLLSTNDKTIKFWKVQEKKVKKVSDVSVDPSKAAGNGSAACSSVSSSSKQHLANGGYSLTNDLSFPPGGIPSLRLPVVTSLETSLVARCRRVYAHAHDYHINSISNNSDGETFISADDLRINLWNLEISNQSFNIVDVKPQNMEDLTGICPVLLEGEGIVFSANNNIVPPTGVQQHITPKYDLSRVTKPAVLHRLYKKQSKIPNISLSVRCDVCNILCDTHDVLEKHRLGKKHKKNLEKLKASVAGGPAGGVNPDTSKAGNGQTSKKKAASTPEELEAKRRRVLGGGTRLESLKMCSVCNVVCNSDTVYQAHLAGKMHQSMLKKQARAKLPASSAAKSS